MPNPQFSVVITCHNQCQYIADAVDSALSQIHASREVIVVDDGSTDGSESLLKTYGDKIRLISLKQNQGAPAARNAGTAAAQGDYIAYLDGDDALKPWALPVYSQIIQAFKPVLILGSLSWFEGAIPAQGGLQAPNRVEFVRYDNWVQKDRSFRSSASVIVVERKSVQTTSGWTREVWPFDDQYLAAELAFSGKAVHIQEPSTVFYRLHSNNTIHDVALLIDGCYRLVESSESNQRFAGKNRGMAAAALIGGPAFWAVKEAFRTGHSVQASRLLLRVWPWVAAAALNRARTLVTGQRPTETLPVQIRSATPASRAAAVGLAS
jgi:glycosyltransferase involved in cell wall biosynthesis